MRNLVGVLPYAVRYWSWKKPPISKVSYSTLILITFSFFWHFVRSAFLKISVAHQIYTITPLLIFFEKSDICVIFSSFQITYALSSLAISLQTASFLLSKYVKQYCNIFLVSYFLFLKLLCLVFIDILILQFWEITLSFLGSLLVLQQCPNSSVSRWTNYGVFILGAFPSVWWLKGDLQRMHHLFPLWRTVCTFFAWAARCLCSKVFYLKHFTALWSRD